MSQFEPFHATGVAFHSASGALAETKHVYLSNSGVARRLESGEQTSVLEVGLGTAMGMLVTVDLAVTNGASVNYLALERQWLSADVIRQLQIGHWVVNQAIAESYLHWRSTLPESVPEGVYQWSPTDEVSVAVQVGDALDWRPEQEGCFDAIYFDPFAPEENAELWTCDYLRRMRAALADDGKLTTYCVSRLVRDNLVAAGLSVDVVAGPPGGKRNVLIAQKDSAAR